MRNLGTLYGAELRKILTKKAVWIAMALGAAFVLLVGLTNLSADGRGAYVKYQEEILSQMSGQKLDDAFFENFRQEIAEETQSHWELYEKINAFDPAAIPVNAAANLGKRALYDLIYNVMRDREAVMTVTAEKFYTAMRENILHDGRELGSTSEELDFWLKEFDSIPRPMTYAYAQAYQNILDVLFLIGWILFLNISVALAGVFADEKTCRTDAMILSARNGRLPVCAAKLLAGITVAFLQATTLLGLCFGVMLAFYGAHGWDAAIQLVIPSSPWHITIGTMVLIYFGLAAVTSLLFALTNLAVSHFTRSATAAMAIHAAVLFAGLFNVPAKLGWIAKLWQLRPTMALYYGTFCNTCRYGRFNNVQVSLLAYSVFAVLLALGLMLSYRSAQVESR